MNPTREVTLVLRAIRRKSESQAPLHYCNVLLGSQVTPTDPTASPHIDFFNRSAEVISSAPQNTKNRLQPTPNTDLQPENFHLIVFWKVSEHFFKQYVR